MPAESSGSNGGGTTITGNAIAGYRAKILLSSMRIYLESNGTMRSTRAATPSNMCAIASEYTGKTYPRRHKGLEKAYSDMLLLTQGKNLDEIGQVDVVNKEVGGIAADLT